VEFAAVETNTARMCGLATGPETGATASDITYGLVLGATDHILISEGGVNVPGTDSVGGFGTYATGDRFRVSVMASNDGVTGTITYSRIPATCTDPSCVAVLHTTPVAALAASYPFRIDASLSTQGGALTDVRVVRIQ
jgi:hypothetical protein